MNICATRKLSQHIQKGFTLIELMVVMALVAIVTQMAIPSWTAMIASNRVRTAANNWTQSFYFARSEAIRQNTPMTICASSDGSSCTDSGYEVGWIVKTGLPDASGIVLQDSLPLKGITLTPSATTARAITILPNGLPIGNFAGASLTAQEYPATSTSPTKQITIARTGRIKVY